MTAAGACPRRASCAWATTGSRWRATGRSSGPSPTRRACTGSWTWRGSPPELREDRGEMDAAREGRLPRLVTLEDLRGDLHSHSDWSDGVHAIEVMAEAARRRGYAYQVLTDHSQGLGIAHGLEPERVERQRSIIAALNARFEAEEARRRASRGRGSRGLPAAPRLRAGGPGGRDAGLRGRPARPLRPRRGVGPRRPQAAPGAADPPDAERASGAPTWTWSPTRPAG